MVRIVVTYTAVSIGLHSPAEFRSNDVRWPRLRPSTKRHRRLCARSGHRMDSAYWITQRDGEQPKRNWRQVCSRCNYHSPVVVESMSPAPREEP